MRGDRERERETGYQRLDLTERERGGNGGIKGRKTGREVQIEERSSNEMVILQLREKRKRGNERDQNKSRMDQVEDKEWWEVRDKVTEEGC